MSNAIAEGICTLVPTFAATHNHLLGNRMQKSGMTEADSWEFLEGLVVLKQQGDVLLLRVFEDIDG